MSPKRSKHYSSSDGEPANESKSKEKRKKKVHWPEDAEAKLLQLWEEYVHMLNEYGKLRKADVVHQEIANELANEGFSYIVPEIRAKLHNLTSKYRLEKKVLEQSGGFPKWHLYDAVHSILGQEVLVIAEEKENDSATNNLEAEYCPENEFEAEEDTDPYPFKVETAQDIQVPEEDIEDTGTRARKRGEKHTYDMLQALRYTTDIMRREADDRRRADAKMIRLQEELLETERERNEILKKLLEQHL